MTAITNQIKHINWKNIWKQIYPAALSLLLAFLIGGLLLLASGRDPVAAYKSLLTGAFGSSQRFTETLVKMTPFLILAISVSISFRCGIWNIGAEGQLILGAITSTWVALTFSSLSPFIVMPLTLVAGIIGGAFWSGLAGFLKAYFNANEVITTSMLNFIAVYLLAFLVNGPLKDPEGFNFPQSALINSSFELPRLLTGSRLNIAFIVALLLVVGAIMYWRSTIGFRTEIVGASRRVARHIGLNVNWTIILVTLISGGLAGITGWGEIFGLHFRLIEAIAIGMGSLAVVVALLGELHPLGMVASAFLFAALVVGGNAMERSAGVPFALVDVIQGVIILLILARSYIFRGKAS
ncbi:MAG: ABC transporter permease [Chloroflexi bacterium]|nr:MAG: ABC transporter permease [Chloroflexota bacterium]PIE80740.1 MAG: ABC transporter permease [Chloroflexota bacterium]